jgi:hypothetical protein
MQQRAVQLHTGDGYTPGLQQHMRNCLRAAAASAQLLKGCNNSSTTPEG